MKFHNGECAFKSYIRAMLKPIFVYGMDCRVCVCVCVVLWFIGMVCTLKIYNYLFISYAVSSFSFCLSQNFPFVLTFWNDASTSYRGLMMFFFNMSIRFDCFAVTFHFDFFIGWWRHRRKLLMAWANFNHLSPLPAKLWLSVPGREASCEANWMLRGQPQLTK